VLTKPEVEKIQGLLESNTSDNVALALSLLESLEATPADYEAVLTDKFTRAVAGVAHEWLQGGEATKAEYVRYHGLLVRPAFLAAWGDASALAKPFIDLVDIPAGSFMMGSPEDETDRNDLENQVEVRITKPFAIGRTVVTRGQWGAIGTTTRPTAARPIATTTTRGTATTTTPSVWLCCVEPSESSVTPDDGSAPAQPGSARPSRAKRTTRSGSCVPDPRAVWHIGRPRSGDCPGATGPKPRWRTGTRSHDTSRIAWAKLLAAGGGGVSARVPSVRRRHPADRLHHRAGGDSRQEPASAK